MAKVNVSKSKCTAKKVMSGERKEVTFRKIQRINLRIVEEMSDCEISAAEFIDKCQSMDKECYDCILEERNYNRRCGYPLCSKPVQDIKQQYRIVLSRKKVYDLKDRKCFCSETCYAASNYVRCQLLDFLKGEDDEPIVVKLLSDHKNDGCIGEIVTLEEHQSYSFDEVDEKDQTADSVAQELKKLLLDDLTKDTEQFGKFEVTERSVSSDKNTAMNNQKLSQDAISTKIQGGDSLTKEVKKPMAAEQRKDNQQVEQPEQSSHIVSVNKMRNKKPPISVKSSCSSNHATRRASDSNSDMSDVDDDIYFYSKEVNVASEEQILSKRSRKIQPPRVIEPGPKSITNPPQPVSKNHVVHILNEWITVASLELIKNGNSKCPEAQVSENPVADNKDNISKISKSCTTSNLELHSRDKETEIRTANKENDDELAEMKMAKSSSNPYLEKVKEFLKGEEHLQKEKPVTSVKFKTGRKGKFKIIKNEVAQSESSNLSSSSTSRNTEVEEEEAVLPAIDSLSINLVRQKVVFHGLKNTFCAILPYIGLQYSIFGDFILRLVATFKLTAENVNLKPNEWKLAAIFLFRMIMNGPLLKDTLSTQLTSNSIFQLLENTSLIQGVSVRDIDGIISRLLCMG